MNLAGFHGIKRDNSPLPSEGAAGMDCRGKHGSATMLYTVLAILVAVLSYAFFQAAHHVDPNARPHAPLHDTK